MKKPGWLLILMFNALLVNAGNNMYFDPIIPFRLIDKDLAVNDIRRIKKEYGFRRFIFTVFNMNTPAGEMPSLQAYEEFAHSVNAIKAELNDPEIELNWWCVPTLGFAHNSNYQRIINFDGKVSEHYACPLDENFRKDLAERVATAVRIARFPIIQFEDDCELSNHPNVTFGCFCPLHLAELEKRIGRKITREELALMYKEDKRETRELRRIFDQVRQESLALFARDIRKAVDEVSPETRISLCEPGTTDYDGDLSMALPPAFAGKNLRPLIRVYGSNYYSNDSPQTLPWQLAHAMFSAERLPKTWELMHESDTHPHSRFFMSEKYLRTLMTHAYFFGMTNSLLYACQYLDDPDEDTGYLAMARDNRLFFRELIRSCQSGHLDGIRVYHHTESTSMPRLTPAGTVWIGDVCYNIGRLGIPYSTRHGSPVVLAGEEANSLSDAEIKELLQGSLLLDGPAAEILEQRGFSEFIGVKTERFNGGSLPLEFLADIPEFAHIRGKMIYNHVGLSRHRMLKPLKGAEVLSTLSNNKRENPQPAVCRFVNKNGGRVVVLSCEFAGQVSSNLLSYRKKQMLKTLIEWLRQQPLPAFAAETPNTWVLVRNTDQYVILALTSLTCSDLTNVRIDLSPELQGDIEELNLSGKWESVRLTRQDNSIIVPELKTLHTRIFRICKKR